MFLETRYYGVLNRKIAFYIIYFTLQKAHNLDPMIVVQTGNIECSNLLHNRPTVAFCIPFVSVLTSSYTSIHFRSLTSKP